MQTETEAGIAPVGVRQQNFIAKKYIMIHMNFESENLPRKKNPEKPELSEMYVGSGGSFVNGENKIVERMAFENIEDAVGEARECVSLARMAARGFDFSLITPERMQDAFDAIQKAADRISEEIDSFEDSEKNDILFRDRAKRLKEVVERMEDVNGELVDAARELSRAEAEEERSGEENDARFRLFEKSMIPASPSGFNMIQGQLDYFTGEFPER